MISILCPTRGRPHNVRRMTDSVLSLAAGPVEIVFYADDDDPATAALLDQMRSGEQLPINYVVGPRIVLSQMWNRCAEAARYDILGHSDDDVVYRTPGWDRLVADAFGQVPDRILFVHGRDGVHDARFGTHGFIHRRWMDAVGYFVPPYFSCDWNDTWLNDVANTLGRRRYLPDLYTEHMHPVVGKAEWDTTHHERMARGGRDNVDALYASLAHERAADAAKLRTVMT